jgi:glutamate--cysteine ligase
LGKLGIEVELFVIDRNDRQRIPGPDELREVLGAGPTVDTWLPSTERLPGGSRLTFEPGGQLELSGPPLPGLAAVISAMRSDIAEISRRLATAGLAVRGGGLEAVRSPYRWVHGQRYDAMAAHFRRCGPQSERAGAVMMTATAALQINLDAGGDAQDAQERWRRAHVLAPTLAAMFASSPVLSGRPTGAASGRLTAWQSLDPCRTAPVANPAGVSAGEAWARYALSASVFLVPDVDGGHPAPSPFTLGEWIDDPGLAGRVVTSSDIDYHLTTLFPPIRPRGFVELRYLDGQDLEHWPVAVAVVAALHDDPAVAPAANEVCAGVAGHWQSAAKVALADPELARAARDLSELAIGSLARRGAPGELVTQVEAFADEYVLRERCPADDIDLRQATSAGSSGKVGVVAGEPSAVFAPLS